MHRSLTITIAGALLGILVGTAVAVYDFVVNSLLWANLENVLSPEQLCLAPLVGMLLTWAVVKATGLSSTAMADEVVDDFHQRRSGHGPRHVLGKVIASLTTMGFGGSAGMEGASKWLGGQIGTWFQTSINRLPICKLFHERVHITMLAGAASGIAAIFRAPLTGAVLGLESPYKRDIAYEVLAHALVASAASYATYAFLRTGQPYFPVAFRYELDYSDLLLCVPLGVAAGLSAKGFNLTLDRIRRASLKLGSESFFRYLIGGCLLSAIAQGLLISIQNPASLHSGLAVTQNLLAQDPSLHYGAMVFVGKLLATAVCFGMGGVGGLFLPSATIGAAIGACAEAIYPSSQPGMLILVGIGAFTGASYNSLLFSAVFIAETTGNPALVVPSLIASSIAYLTTSGVSNSKFQRLERQSGDQGHTFG